jgi:16S rRNA (guanine(966)-N(2))-methyltransferase RsmD
MRIIGGKYGGRVLKVPEFSPTRPTTNIAKEALFNIIENYYNFDNIRFLDLFGGTGQLSYEMASRGCTDITIVEQFPKCVKFIEQTINLLEIQGMRVYPIDIFKYIKIVKNEKFDLIFAGPPYPLPNLPDIPDLVFENDLIEGEGWFVMEHNPQHSFKKHPHFWKQNNYGQTIFSIFTNAGRKKE